VRAADRTTRDRTCRTAQGLWLGAGLALSALALVGCPAKATPVDSPVPGVVVVRGDLLGPGGEPNRPRAEAAFQSVRAMLSRLSILHTVTSDSAVEREGLPAGAIAVFPYSRAVSEAEAQAVARFVEGGGKVIVFFTGRSDLLGWAGVRLREWRTNTGTRANGRVRPLRGLPGVDGPVAWRGPQVAAVELLEGSETVAVWAADAGQEPEVAAAVGPFGAFVTLLPEAEPSEQQARLLRALLGEVMPSVWRRMIACRSASALLTNSRHGWGVATVTRNVPRRRGPWRSRH